jgi:adenosine deaminase
MREAPARLDLFRRMPKAELHLHLDGSLRPETALELARERELPGWGLQDLPEPLEALAAMRAALVGPPQARDQAELLRAFDLPIAILQDRASLERVTTELVEDCASDGTRYVEIRWAPSLHLKHGLSLRDGIGAVVRGAQAGTARAESASHRIVVRLIAVAMRSHPPPVGVKVAESAASFLRDGLTGFDLAGAEQAHPDPLRHRAAVGIARAAGLGISCHAGEWGGARQVARALELHPDRIAHGAPAITDARLCAELVSRGVTLDLCPTSNVQAAIYPRLADHPLARLHRAGIRVTLSTDDRTVSDLTLPLEYLNASVEVRATVGELWRMNLQALRSAFLQHDEMLRRRLIEQFQAFAARDADLRRVA